MLGCDGLITVHDPAALASHPACGRRVGPAFHLGEVMKKQVDIRAAEAEQTRAFLASPLPTVPAIGALDELISGWYTCAEQVLDCGKMWAPTEDVKRLLRTRRSLVLMVAGTISRELARHCPDDATLSVPLLKLAGLAEHAGIDELAEASFAVQRLKDMQPTEAKLQATVEEPPDTSGNGPKVGPDPDRKVFHWNGTHDITKRNWELARALWGRGRVSFAEIGENVWGDDSTPESTIKVQLSRLGERLMEIEPAMAVETSNQHATLKVPPVAN